MSRPVLFFKTLSLYLESCFHEPLNLFVCFSSGYLFFVIRSGVGWRVLWGNLEQEDGKTDCIVSSVCLQVNHRYQWMTEWCQWSTNTLWRLCWAFDRWTVNSNWRRLFLLVHFLQINNKENEQTSYGCSPVKQLIGEPGRAIFGLVSRSLQRMIPISSILLKRS